MSDMNEDMTADQERAMDVLLDEIYQQSAPPDLSAEILAALGDLREPSATDIVCEPAIKTTAAPTSNRKQITVAISLLAALAASLLTLIWLAPDSPTLDGTSTLAENDTAPPNQDISDVASNDATPTPTTDVMPKEVTPRKGIPLVIGSQDASDPTPGRVEPPKRRAPSSSVAVTLVSSEVRSDLLSYWDAIEIETSQEATSEETAQRLASVLGVKISADAIGDPELIRRELARPRVARSIAKRWMQQITQGGLNRIDEESRNRIVNEVSKSLRSKSSFDELVAKWTAGKSPNTSAFYSAIGVEGEHQMIRRLASLTMNVDLRCVQCHDSLIEGTGRQADYWSFATFVRHGLKRDKNGWSINKAKKTTKPVYYSLPDGRQKVAEASVPKRWLSQTRPVTDMEQWSDALVGSPEFAHGIVNSLWKLVHGQPLQGRVIDTVTAPHHESLVRLEDRLTTDLVESGFDVGRTLSLIIASPASNRSIPEALRPENALASVSDINAAMQSVNAFAAALPPRDHLPLNRRIDIAMERIGAKIDDVNSVLAQPIDSPSRPSSTTGVRPKVGNDFPGKAASLPVQWLSSIESESGKIEHLGYLSGMSKVPTSLVDAAKALRDSDEDETLVLQRVWWLVRP